MWYILAGIAGAVVGGIIVAGIILRAVIIAFGKGLGW